MSRFVARVSPLLLLASLALPASAEVFHVTLKNGSVIETASRPQQASWDGNMVLLLTDMGNWVGFPKDDIVGIRSEDPIQGFGIRISDKAVMLGLSPNDLPEAKGKDDVNSKFFDLANRMLEMADQQQHYSVQQFVDPNQTQGIPAAFGGNYSGATAPGGFGGLQFTPDTSGGGGGGGNEAPAPSAPPPPL
jgi:hypothetical protein